MYTCPNCGNRHSSLDDLGYCHCFMDEFLNSLSNNERKEYFAQQRESARKTIERIGISLKDQAEAKRKFKHGWFRYVLEASKQASLNQHATAVQWYAVAFLKAPNTRDKVTGECIIRKAIQRWAHQLQWEDENTYRKPFLVVDFGTNNMPPSDLSR